MTVRSKLTVKRSSWLVTLIAVAIIGTLLGGCASQNENQSTQSGAGEKKSDALTAQGDVLYKQSENHGATTAASIQVIGIPIQADQSSGIENADGTVTYQITNGEEVAASLDVDHPKEVTLTLFGQESQPVSKSGSDSIANITGPKEVCGAIAAASNSSVNQSDSTMVQSIDAKGDVSNTYVIHGNQQKNSNAPDASSVSKAVGFDVTRQWKMNDPVQWALAPGESIIMQDYPYYEEYQFDIMEHKLFGASKKVGSGAAYQCIGFCRVVGE